MELEDVQDDDQGFDHEAWVEQAVQAKGLDRQRKPKARGHQVSRSGRIKSERSARAYTVTPAEEGDEDWQARWAAQSQDWRHKSASGVPIQGPGQDTRSSSQRYMATGDGEDRQDGPTRDAGTSSGTQVVRKQARSIRRGLQDEANADDWARGTDRSSDIRNAPGGAPRRKLTGSARWEDEEEEGPPSRKSEEGGVRRRDASLGGSGRLSAGHRKKKEGQQPRSYAVDPHQDEPQEPEEQLEEQSLAAGQGRARSRTPTDSPAVEDRDRPSYSKRPVPAAGEPGRVRKLASSGRKIRSGLAEAEAEDVEERSSRPEPPGRARPRRRQRSTSGASNQRRSQGEDADDAEDSGIDQEYL